MAHRVPRCPGISVVMAVHDGAGHFARSVESVLNQSYADLELMLVDCASTDRTPALMQSFHDRDIRVELIERDDDDIAAGLVSAIERARSPRVLMLRQEGWLAPGALETVHALVDGDAPDIVFLSRSDDSYDGKGHLASTRKRRVAQRTWGADDDLAGVAALLYEEGLLSDAYGTVLMRESAREHGGLLTSERDGGFAFVLACFADAHRVGVVDGPLYHDAAYASGAAAPFDPAFARQCAHEHRLMMDLLRSRGADGDPAIVAPVHRKHVRDLIACIDNASIGSSAISASERLDRVQTMIDDADVRDSLAAVEDASSEFGIMYRPMSRRNAAGCCMGARLRELVRISHLPLGFML